uniref:C2H2-type domain-containing protein n=1 Tax=Strix occidentalis caurina TaxID=311401 RepID=A0A8D0FA10_STROC
MSLKSPQLSPFGLPTGAGTDKQKEEQCQPREEQRGMLQGPKEEPQSPTVDVEHDGQQQPDDSQGSHRARSLRKQSPKVTYDEHPEEATTQPQRTSREKKYKCEHCGKVFTRNYSLRCHRWTHTGENPFKCQDCGKPSRGGRGDFWACEIGNEGWSKLRVHQRTHTGEKTFKCQDCGKVFCWLGTLKYHQLTHTGEKPFKCQDCGKTFRTNGNLLRHKVTHTKDKGKAYTCEHCGKVFTCGSNLNRHRRIHTGEKPFKCQDCGKSFMLSWYLLSHQRTHTKEKPYLCTTCGKYFSCSSTLHVHQRIHTGERPYACLQCEMTFRYRDQLRRHQHQQTHTGESLYPCSHCGKKFLQRFQLRVHQEAFHNGESSEGDGLLQSPPDKLFFTSTHGFSCFFCFFPLPGFTPSGWEQPRAQLCPIPTCPISIPGPRRGSFGWVKMGTKGGWWCGVGEAWWSRVQNGGAGEMEEELKNEEWTHTHTHMHTHTRAHTPPRPPWAPVHLHPPFLHVLVHTHTQTQPSHLQVHTQQTHTHSPCDYTLTDARGAPAHDGQQQPDDTQGSHGTRKPRKCSFKGTYAEDPQDDTTQPPSSSGQKMYKCEDCGNVFACGSSLSRHRRTHTGEKPYKCRDCGKSFTQTGNLLSHQRTHTKEKHFVYTMCGKRFSLTSDLMKHKRTHNPEKLYPCSHCGKSFQQINNLRRHQEALHKGESLGRFSVRCPRPWWSCGWGWPGEARGGAVLGLLLPAWQQCWAGRWPWGWICSVPRLG